MTDCKILTPLSPKEIFDICKYAIKGDYIDFEFTITREKNTYFKIPQICDLLLTMKGEITVYYLDVKLGEYKTEESPIFPICYLLNSLFIDGKGDVLKCIGRTYKQKPNQLAYEGFEDKKYGLVYEAGNIFRKFCLE